MRRVDADLIEMKLDDCDIKMRRMSSMTLDEITELTGIMIDDDEAEAIKALKLLKLLFVSSSDGKTSHATFGQMTVRELDQFLAEWSDLHTSVKLDDE